MVAVDSKLTITNDLIAVLLSLSLIILNLMCKRSCCVFLAVIVALLGIATHFLLTKLDFYKTITLLNQDKCRTLETPLAVEDLEVFLDKYLVGALDDKVTLHETKDIHAAQNGGIIAWRLDDIDHSMHLVPMQGFPKGVRFQGHGIYLEKETHTLYVLNHAY